MTDTAALLLRLVIGAIFLAHGWPKVFGDPEGTHGRAGTGRLLEARGLPFPRLAAWGVGISEVGGGLLVLVGLFTRIALVPFFAILSGAVVVVKWKRGFVDGWDWPFGLLGACVASFLLGPGAVSLDALVGLAD